MTSSGLSTHIWLEARIRDLSAQGIGVYVLQKGEKHDGQVLVKVTDCSGKAKLYMRQRDLMSNALVWIDAIESDAETEVDAYIDRAKDRDPDIWILEVEDQEMKNPFS